MTWVPLVVLRACVMGVDGDDVQRVAGQIVQPVHDFAGAIHEQPCQLLFGAVAREAHPVGHDLVLGVVGHAGFGHGAALVGGVVPAAATGEGHLLDHGHAGPQLGGTAGGRHTGKTGAHNDDVGLDGGHDVAVGYGCRCRLPRPAGGRCLAGLGEVAAVARSLWGGRGAAGQRAEGGQGARGGGTGQKSPSGEIGFHDSSFECSLVGSRLAPPNSGPS